MAPRPRKIKRDARILKAKALSSLRRALTAFNSHDEDGRTAAVLLHLQHAGEMLVKAALIQKGQPVFEKKTNKSKGFNACLNIAPQYLGSSAGECGVFRAVDAMRDTEQHWYAVVPEELLYTEARALVTAFDELLSRAFREHLADHLPTRVLPVSTLPLPADISLLFDSKFTHIRELLKAGKRQRDEARGLIRTLLAMEAHIAEEVEVNEKDVDRVEKGIRAGKAWDVVFPRLAQITAAFEGEGNAVVVHISRQEGAPVRIIKADDPTEADATAIREVDLQKRYRYSPRQLADHVGLREHHAAALKKHMKIDDDSRCTHVFTFGSQQHKRYSDDAVQRLRDAKKTVDVEKLYRDSLEARRKR